MNLIELSKVLKIEEIAPVNYDTNYARENGLRCVFFEKESDESINNLQKKIGIHIPSFEIDEYIRRENNGNPYMYEYINNMIKTLDFSRVNNNLLFASFCLLHEEGHWVDLQESGLSGQDYMSRHSAEMKPVMEQVETIKKLDDSKELKHILARAWILNYRNLTIENVADNYALKKMKKMGQFFMEINN